MILTSAIHPRGAKNDCAVLIPPMEINVSAVTIAPPAGPKTVLDIASTIGVVVLERSVPRIPVLTKLSQEICNRYTSDCNYYCS